MLFRNDSFRLWIAGEDGGAGTAKEFCEGSGRQVRAFA